MTPKLWTIRRKFGGHATKSTFLPEQGLRHFSIVNCTNCRISAKSGVRVTEAQSPERYILLGPLMEA